MEELTQTFPSKTYWLRGKRLPPIIISYSPKAVPTLRPNPPRDAAFPWYSQKLLHSSMKK
uniref:Uncharacterized protein n=1 Tax=Picea glauca TaxID=3330 RepID=A0A117NGZ7_PICGL|nr:hypothetical protein ABT39_MTgene5743 [Picea glauca]